MAALLVVAACGGSAEAVRVAAAPVVALYDAPFVTTVSGLRSGEQVTLRLTSRARDGTIWSSSAQFGADSRGAVSTAQAPLPGSAYSGADPMGLVENLTSGQLGASFLIPTPWTMTAAVQAGGKTVGSATVRRQTPSEVGVRQVDQRPASDGVYGEVELPARIPPTPAPGVVVFGGSEGGLHTTLLAATLAAHGFPALALAYFDEPGLPANLERIPLEYFAAATRLLAAQPGVDPHRMVLLGISRGSEAALLIAAHYPQLVDGVIAPVPSAEALPGLPDLSQPSWTLGGVAVPTAPAEDYGGESLTSPAAIPVELITGPILMVCGGFDRGWNSCLNSQLIADRLRAHSRPTPTLLAYPDAGHFVGGLLPYLPSTSTTSHTATGMLFDGGGTPTADQAGDAKAWPRVLDWLRKL